MRTLFLSLFAFVTLPLAYGQGIVNPFYTSSNSVARSNGYYLNSNLSSLRNDIFLVNNRAFSVLCNSEIPADVRKGSYFFDNEFHKGELVLDDDKNYKSDYTFRFNLLTGSIEMKHFNDEILIFNTPQIKSFSLNVKDKFFNFKQLNVSGTPYFYNDAFHSGELILTRNRHYKSEFQYRLNQYTGSIDVKYPDNQIFAIDNKEVQAFSLNIENKDVNFIQVPLADKPNEFKLMQVIYFSSNIKLLRNVHKDIQQDIEVKSAYLDIEKSNVNYQYKENYHYFISNKDKPLEEVQLTEKSLTKALPEKKKELKKLFSQAKYADNLTVSKVFDLMKALDKNIK